MNIRHLLRIVFHDNMRDTTNTERNVGIYGSLFFAVVSIVLTGMNIQKHYSFMTGTTSVLIVGFLTAMVFAIKERLFVSRIITAVMCMIIFSIYAITGENEGFAILWILLVPIIGMNLVGLK